MLSVWLSLKFMSFGKELNQFEAVLNHNGMDLFYEQRLNPSPNDKF